MIDRDPLLASDLMGLDHDLARWEQYLADLDEAGQAMDRARRIVPDHGLDHGVQRLRAMLLAGVEELDRMRVALKASLPSA
jgi:hypothetical protein